MGRTLADLTYRGFKINDPFSLKTAALIEMGMIKKCEKLVYLQALYRAVTCTNEAYVDGYNKYKECLFPWAAEMAEVDDRRQLDKLLDLHKELF